MTDEHRAGLNVVPYTFRDENSLLPLDYRVGTDPAAYGYAFAEFDLFFDLDVDGAFTDNTDTAVAARADWLAGHQKRRLTVPSVRQSGRHGARHVERIVAASRPFDRCGAMAHTASNGRANDEGRTAFAARPPGSCSWTRSPCLRPCRHRAWPERPSPACRRQRPRW